MKTTSHSVSQIGTIDKVLFALFFIFYVAVIVFASAVLTGCAPADQTVIGGALEEEVSADSKQDASELKGATSVTGRSSNGGATDSMGGRNGSSSTSDTSSGTRTVGDTNNGTNGGSSTNDGSNLADNGLSDGNGAPTADGNGAPGNNDGGDDNDTDDTDTADGNNDNGTSIGISDIIASADIKSSDIKASVIQDTAVSIAADTNTGQKSDIITITQDVITTVKDVITDIIKDTSAGIILDIIASADNGGQKLDSKGQFDIGGASDISATPDSQIVKDTSAVQDAQIWYDTQVAKDAQSAKDAQAQQETQNQQDTQTQPVPDVFIAPNNQTTWYVSKEYKYKVQYPSWVQATILKTTDIQLTGNVLNKVGLTDKQLLDVAHFILRTEFEYHPEYAAPYDEWWKYLYGKPDETATYQGQTLKFQSIDGGAGFNRFTYVKIGKVGALRIEMSFYMPPHLYVEGFEQKALEVLYMVTKSAQAAN